ncbi:MULTISPECIES: M48 family metallopeptidase [Prosthecochloris]|uniref:M48 family metallopeptidase n=1 Tax=Prosthecochloris vibrioformis TaxID=1098 RepID=A0A5C4S1B9_PROVB|nr:MULTISPECIES: M48 family metallopeptidase [Prosthecochloris]ANT64402.1 Protease HtpX [Prosthecochloris sp. CIB 2401]TNJ37254.1 M48 family metallopeptidase [Prosthecochloris vibrioformis]
MNVYGSIVLGTLMLSFLLQVVADLLNLRSSRQGLPDEFRGVYDEDAYSKAQRYLKSSTSLSLSEASLGILVLFFFWFSGGFQLLDAMVREMVHGEVLRGVIYIGALGIARSILDLPFGIYRTFVLEERFGFNKTTPSTYALDLFKAVVLSVLLGGPILWGVLSFFTYGGELAWVWAWGVFTLFGLLLQYVAPTMIMPLFNRFTPLEEGSLKTAILEYARSVDFPLQGIYVIDGSRRSAKANAFFTGFGRNKRIALFDTLIDNHTEEELVAVLAHEIGHYKNKHILQSMLLNMITMGFLFYLLSVFLNNRELFDAFYLEELSVYASLVLFSLLYTPVEFLLSIFLQMLSRRNEFQADHYAVTTYSGGRALLDALKKLSRSNLSNLTPHPLYVMLNYSHPPLLERITRIRTSLS